MSAPIAVVTGGIRGIGAAAAALLVADGYEVLALDRTDPKDALPKGVRAARADVCDRASMAAALDSIGKNGAGKIDVFVHCAGSYTIRPFFEITEADVRAMCDVHILGAIIGGQESAKRMNDGGRIVNVVSRGYLGMPNAAHYVAAKAGLVGLTRAMAIDLAPRKIRVNAVAPGAVDTDMTRVQPEEVRARMAKAEPLGRLIDPQTIAASIAFLARPDTYINGHILVVDGGRAAGIMPG